MTRTFLKNAAILTATSLLLRGAGMLFRIYTSRVVGAEGMGVYQLILSVHMLLAAFAGSGISTAVTRLCTDALAHARHRTVRRILRRSLWLSAGIGILLGVGLFAVAVPVGTGLLRDARTVAALRVMGLCFPFLGVTACLRGYFLARRRVAASAGSQLLEQAVRMGLVILLLSRIDPGRIDRSCCVLMLGDTAAECVSCLWLWLRCRRDVRSLTLSADEPPLPILRPLLSIALPITAGRYLSTGLRTVENLLVPGCLTAFGGSREQALSSFGALKGMALPLLFFPSSFLGAFSTLLLPEISEAHALGQSGRVRYAVRRTLRLTLLSSLLIAGIFTVYAPELGQWIYGSAEVGRYLRVLGPLMPLMYTESVVDGILKGLNQQNRSLAYSAADSASRILLILVLVPRQGMTGFLAVMVFSNLLTCSLSVHRLLTVTGVRFDWLRWLLLPLPAVGGAAAVTVILSRQFPLPAIPTIIAGTVSVTALYTLLLWLTGCIGREPRSLRRRTAPVIPLPAADTRLWEDSPADRRIF